MKVLVIGSSGREHAIIWKLSQSRHVSKIYCCPGNAGIAEIAECIDVSPDDFDALIDFVKYEWIDLTIVGHGEPLSRGIVDAFEKEGCRILGPSKATSQLVSSRVFAKDFMRIHRIPTAEYKVFTSYLHAEEYVRLKGTPIVIRTDELIEDDGVFVASTVEEAIDALRIIMKERVFGNAGKRVIVEDYLRGKEVSFMIFTDGKAVVPLASLQNHEHIFNFNKGSNTASMGAYSPAPIITKKLEMVIMKKIMQPVLKALNSEGIKYKGVLSADLIVDRGKPCVLRFNCCFGDLGIQTVIQRLEADLMEIALAIIEERLSDMHIGWSPKTSVCVMIFSEGYPGKYQKGAVIKGLEKVKEMEDVVVFHTGTSFNNNDIVTSGGKVMAITSTGSDIKVARGKAYEAIERITFKGMYYIKDVGIDASNE